MSKPIKSNSDLQGLTRIITDATISVTEIVESMHNRIVHPLFLPSSPFQNLITNIAGFTYQNIKWSTQLFGDGLDKALGYITPMFGEIKSSKEREALLAALNGVIGDYLEDKQNPLSITMQLRHDGKSIPLDSESIQKAYPNINGKILLMIHGSSMNDIQWTRQGHNHGESLEKDLAKTPIYLHYNSGLHISTNGQQLNLLLEELVTHWPVPVEEIVIIAHSMGGLVSRSALYYSEQNQNSWTKYLKKIVFLGTPHHGAPLERAGSYFNGLLQYIPYTKPFSRLGKIRSAGVTDLRYGNLIDEDWKGKDRFKIQKDSRIHIPLPEHIQCYSIAADQGTAITPSAKFVGDGLVEIKSALGQHINPDKTLDFKVENTLISFESNHFDLLNNPKIYSKIKEWLT